MSPQAYVALQAYITHAHTHTRTKQSTYRNILFRQFGFSFPCGASTPFSFIRNSIKRAATDRMGQNRITFALQIEYNFNVALTREETKTVQGK